jgi:NAD+ synthetase
MNYELAIRNIRTELKNYILSNSIKSLVIGLSGGIDSCLCAALAYPVCKELGIPLIGRSLPITTNTSDEIARAKLTGQYLCTDFLEEQLDEIFQKFQVINPQIDKNYIYGITNNIFKFTNITENEHIAWKIRNGNIKARLRMIYLYNLASIHNGMVLSTDNYTEYLLGFWTLHGDAADFGMIQNLWKSEVYEMAEWIAKNEYQDDKNIELVITTTINALATDGLGVSTQGDLGQILPDYIGTSRDGYKIVDKKLQDYLEGNVMFNRNDPVIKRHINTHFKRNNPYNIPRETIFKNS